MFKLFKALSCLSGETHGELPRPPCAVPMSAPLFSSTAEVHLQEQSSHTYMPKSKTLHIGYVITGLDILTRKNSSCNAIHLHPTTTATHEATS